MSLKNNYNNKVKIKNCIIEKMMSSTILRFTLCLMTETKNSSKVNFFITLKKFIPIKSCTVTVIKFEKLCEKNFVEKKKKS